jgi:prophage tail gpP-like protein
MTGLVVAQEIPDDAKGGTTIELRLATKFADAWVGSALPEIKVEKTSIKDFITRLLAPLGFTEDDLVFAPAAERDLMTGRPTSGGKAPADLEKIKVDHAKVNPPETTYDAGNRHLKRHALMWWDSPSGKIYIGTPDVDQRPLYRFLSKRGTRAQGNNVLSVRRTADWFDVPTAVTIFGGITNKKLAKATVTATAVNAEMIRAGFERSVYLPMEAIKTELGASNQARRELATRSKRKDCYEVVVDGWSYWTGSYSIPYAHNTTADVDLDALGGVQGRYYVQRVVMREDARNGQTTSVTLVHPNVWRLFPE